MIDMTGMKFPLFAGVGALFGLFISVPLCLISVFFPAFWAYAFAPVWIGAIVGFVWAAFIRD